MTMLLPSARYLITPHSSLLEYLRDITRILLGYLTGISTSVKSSCPTLLKNTSKLGRSEGGFYDDLGQNAGISLKLSEGSFRKWHFISIRLQNSSKSCLNSGSLNFTCIGAKSSPFSKTLISTSDSTLLLKLKIVWERK